MANLLTIKICNFEKKNKCNAKFLLAESCSQIIKHQQQNGQLYEY